MGPLGWGEGWGDLRVRSTGMGPNAGRGGGRGWPACQEHRDGTTGIGWGEPGLGAWTQLAPPKARPAPGIRAGSPSTAQACQRAPIYKQGSREAGKLRTLPGITQQISA